MNYPLIYSFGFAALVSVLSVTPVSAVVSIDYVMVGDAGNTSDPTTGFGAVSYTYNIAKYETTISQYAEFLNAKAKSDSTGLYSSFMGSDLRIVGIQRSGSSGNFTYSVSPGSGNRPISYVSWFDAARFVNWMHNGQGDGSTETGVYSQLQDKEQNNHPNLLVPPLQIQDDRNTYKNANAPCAPKRHRPSSRFFKSRSF